MISLHPYTHKNCLMWWMNTKPPRRIQTWDRTNTDRAHLYSINNWENQRQSNQAQARFYVVCSQWNISLLLLCVLCFIYDTYTYNISESHTVWTVETLEWESETWNEIFKLSQTEWKRESAHRIRKRMY